MRLHSVVRITRDSLLVEVDNDSVPLMYLCICPRMTSQSPIHSCKGLWN
jgi:hypothetical protein